MNVLIVLSIFLLGMSIWAYAIYLAIKERKELFRKIRKTKRTIKL